MFGILGGTFDPIHFGHLVLAEKAYEAFQLSRVVFVPAAIPPHKIGEVKTSAANRLRMVELAIADNPHFQISKVELEREGPSYTIDTIQQLVSDARGEEALLIMGFDSLLELNTWKDYQQLLSEIKVITAFRPGYPILRNENEWPEFLQPFRERILLLEAPLIDISATWLRVELIYARSIRYLLPEPVREYIELELLYREF
jgi:nicotinate-nucleotide adenylyltransferase